MTTGVATVPGILRAGTHAARPAATDVGVGTLYSCSTHNIIYVSDGATWTTWSAIGLTGTLSSVTFIIDGGLTVPGTGSKGFIEIPFACTITGARLAADASGSCVVDIKKATYSGLFSTSSICASAKPTLSSARKAQDTTLTGWTTAVAAGDWLEFNLDSITTITRLSVSLSLLR
jgi:hypothetical protein